MDFSELVKTLGNEKKQEEMSATTAGSFLAGANVESLRSRELEFRDDEKQWVRSNVWLKTAKELAESNNRPLRYLTLPAYYRLDVTLFDQNNLLRRISGAGGNVLDVAAFEADPAKFGRMSTQAPTFRLLGQCGVEQAITDTANPYFAQLSALFPFDLINMDLTSSLTPNREGPYSKTMKALEDILRRQAEHVGQWGLFLTFRNVAPDWESSAVDALADNLQSNIDKHAHVREAFGKRYGSATVKALRESDEACCLSQCVAKWITDRAHHYNINLHEFSAYQYQRYPSGTASYLITKHVYTFEKGLVSKDVLPTKGVPTQTWMIEDLVACVRHHRLGDVEDILYKKELARPGTFDDMREEIRRLCEVVDPTDDGRAGRLLPGEP